MVKRQGVNTTFASSISEKSDHFGSYTVNSSDRLSAEIVPEIKTYNIWVAGIQITEFNQADVLRLLFTPYIYILVKVT